MKRFLLLLATVILAIPCHSQAKEPEKLTFFDAANFTVTVSDPQFPCTSTPNVGLQLPPIGNTTIWGICLNNDFNLIDTLLGGVSTLQVGASGPSVEDYTNWITANTASTAITNFTNGFPGQLIRIICGPGDLFTTITSTVNIQIASPWTCSSQTPAISLVLVGSTWMEVGRAGGSSGGGSTSPGNPAGGLQYNASGLFGGAAFVYNPSDSTGTFCPVTCSDITVVSSASAIALQSSDSARTVYLRVRTDTTAMSELPLVGSTSRTINQNRIPGMLANMGIGGTQLGGACFAVFGISSSSTTPPCAMGFESRFGDNYLDTANGQDAVGFSAQALMNKTSGHNMNSIAGFLMLTPGSFTTSAGAVTETANNVWGVEIQDLQGLGQLQTVGIHIEAQSNPGATNWAIKVEALGGPIGTMPSTLTRAGLNVAPGVTPTSPSNGDIWTTSAGLFAQINGVTIQIGSSSSACISGSGPLGISCSTTFKGPEPYISLASFGGRYGASQNPSFVPVTGTIANGSTTLTLTGNFNACTGPATCWITGDWVDVQNAGQANTMSTPSAPTVRARIASGYPGMNYTVAAVATSSQATVCYLIIARDIGQGTTSKSGEQCISSYQPLGNASANTVSISSCTQSGQIVTCNTSTPHGGAVGALFYTGVAYGLAYYTMATVPSTTQFTFKVNPSTSLGAPTSFSGSTVQIWPCIELVLPAYTTGQVQYFIYKGASGAETYYDAGLWNINSGDPSELVYDDFGWASFPKPSFVPTNAPSTPTNDTLLAQVIAGGQTNSMTLSLPAANGNCASGGCTVLLDNMGAMIAADSYASLNGGECEIPSTFSSGAPMGFNTYGVISHCNVRAYGSLIFYDTVNLRTRLDGLKSDNRASATLPQFALQQLNAIACFASPCILGTGQYGLRGVTVTAASGGVGVLHTTGGSSVFVDDTFTGNGNTSIPFYDFGGVGGNFGFKMDHVSILGVAGVVPVMITKNDGEMNWDYVSMGPRGIADSPACVGSVQSNFTLGQEQQAASMPQFSIVENPNCGDNLDGYVKIHNSIIDTSNQVLFDLLAGPIPGVYGGAIELSGVPAAVGGYPGASWRISESGLACTAQFWQWTPHVVCQNDGSGNEIHNTLQVFNGANPVNTAQQSGIAAGPITPPAAPSVSASTTCPSTNGFPAGTGNYQVIWIDVTGAVTFKGPASSNVTLDGATQCGYITQPSPIPPGVLCWAVYAEGGFGATGLVSNRQGTPTFCPLPPWGGVAWNLATTTAIDQTSFKNGDSQSVNTSALNKMTTIGFYGLFSSYQEVTETQCFSSASPAICGNNIDGFVTIAAGSSSVVVDTSLVTANSTISLTFDTTQGTNLGVTCNTAAQQPYVSARTAGTSFTVSVGSNFTTNPGCIAFHIKN